MTYGPGSSRLGSAKPTRPHFGRLALGLVSLAGERLGGEAVTDRFATAVGLAQHGADQARGVVGRLAEAGAWATRRTVEMMRDRERRDASTRRTREAFDQAQRAGRVTVAASRADAVALLRTTVSDGVAWAQVQVVPRVVD